MRVCKGLLLCKRGSDLIFAEYIDQRAVKFVFCGKGVEDIEVFKNCIELFGEFAEFGRCNTDIVNSSLVMMLFWVKRVTTLPAGSIRFLEKVPVILGPAQSSWGVLL